MKIRLDFGRHYDAVYIERDGEWQRLDPKRSQRVVNHSPTGFAWGYGGSGPAQLALALLLEAGVEPERAARLHQDFKFAHVGTWEHDGYNSSQIVEVDVEGWVAEHAA